MTARFASPALWSGETMTMITCAPNEFMRPIHDRMPDILRDDDYAAWIDPKSSQETLLPLIAPRRWEGVVTISVAKLVPDVDVADAQ